MAENRKPRADIVNDDWVPGTVVVVTAEKFEPVHVAYSVLKEFKFQIKGQFSSGDQFAFLCIDSCGCKLTGQYTGQSVVLQSFKEAFIKSGFIVDESTGTQLSDIVNNVKAFFKPRRVKDNVHKETIGSLTSESLALPSQSVSDGNREGGRNLEMPTSPDSPERSPFEVAKLAMKSYLYLLKTNELTSEQLHDIEINIGILEKAMKDEGESIHHIDAIYLLMNELRALLTSRTLNLQCQSQSYASQSIRDGNREGCRNLAIESVLDDLSQLTSEQLHDREINIGILEKAMKDEGESIHYIDAIYLLMNELRALLTSRTLNLPCQSQSHATQSIRDGNREEGRYHKGKGIELHKVVDIGCRIKKLRKGTSSEWEDIPLGDENVASTSTPSNINNSLHRSSVPDTDNERLGAAGCSRWTTGLKNIFSYRARILNTPVKGDQSKINGACSDLEAGVTRETATTSRGINYSETALSTFVYTLIGLNFSVPFAIMAIRDGRMTKLAEKLILIIALVTLFLETGIIGLISFQGISSYRTAKVFFTIILLLFLGIAVLISLSALRLF